MVAGAKELRQLMDLVSHTPGWRVLDLKQEWHVFALLTEQPYVVAKARHATPAHMANIGRELVKLGWSRDEAVRAMELARLQKIDADRRANADYAEQVAALAADAPLPVYQAALVGDERFLPPGPDPDDTDVYYATDVLVGPELAARMLEYNIANNRPVSDFYVVERLCKAILRKEWVLTHQAAAFDRNGRMFDGQKRMLAIIKTGVAVPMCIAYNVDPAAFAVVDTMQPRTGGHTLHIMGVPNANRMAAAIRAIYMYDNHRDESWAKGVVTNSQIEHIYGRIGDELQAANKAIAPLLKPPTAKGQKREPSLMVSSAAIAAFYMAKRAWPGGAHHEFVRGVATGMDLYPGDPRWVLREYLRNSGPGKVNRRNGRVQIGLYLRCSNDFLHGRTRNHLAWGGAEKMPVPVTGPRILAS